MCASSSVQLDKSLHVSCVMLFILNFLTTFNPGCIVKFGYNCMLVKFIWVCYLCSFPFFTLLPVLWWIKDVYKSRVEKEFADFAGGGSILHWNRSAAPIRKLTHTRSSVGGVRAALDWPTNRFIHAPRIRNRITNNDRHSCSSHENQLFVLRTNVAV